MDRAAMVCVQICGLKLDVNVWVIIALLVFFIRGTELIFMNIHKGMPME